MDYATLFAGAGSQVTGAITDVAPIGLGIVFAITGLSVAVKVFRRLAR